MIELPRQEPCEICETLAGRSNVPVVAESEFTITVVTPVQFEVGQCCVVTRRHAGTLLDLTDEEGTSVIKASRDVAHASLATYKPLGILTFQNNGVYSGQEVPHGTLHDSSSDGVRRRRARVDAQTLHAIAALIRRNMPK